MKTKAFGMLARNQSECYICHLFLEQTRGFWSIKWVKCFLLVTSRAFPWKLLVIGMKYAAW